MQNNQRKHPEAWRSEYNLLHEELYRAENELPDDTEIHDEMNHIHQLKDRIAFVRSYAPGHAALHMLAGEISEAHAQLGRYRRELQAMKISSALLRLSHHLDDAKRASQDYLIPWELYARAEMLADLYYPDDFSGETA